MKNVNLLPHNQAPYERLAKLFGADCKSALYVSGTGTGKSYITKALLDTTFAKAKVAYVIPTLSLAKYANDVAGFNVYKKRLTYFTYNYFLNFDKALREMSKYDLIILDEAHHIGSEKSGNNVIEIMHMVKAKFLGLTATPDREDSFPLRKVFDKVVQGISTIECIDMGLMSKFDYIVCSPRIDRLTPEERRKAQINFLSSYELLSSILTTSQKNKWLVFCSSVEQLEEVKPMVRNILPEHDCLTLHSAIVENPTDILEELEKSEKCILFSCDMLLEGYHVPTVDGVLLFRNVQSFTVFQQILGRVSSIGSKVSPLIVDCTETAYKLLTRLLHEDKTVRNAPRQSRYQDVEKPTHHILNMSLELQQYYDVTLLLRKIKNKRVTGDIVVNHKTYESAFDCCQDYGVSYRKVMKYMTDNDMTFEQAVMSLALLKVSKFVVKDRDYHTFSGFCSITGTPPDVVRKLARVNNMTYAEACAWILDTCGFCCDGAWYYSKQICLRRLGISKSVFDEVKTRHNWTDAQTIHYLTTMSKTGTNWIGPVVYNGVRYSSLASCCEKLDLNQAIVILYVADFGLSLAEAIDKAMQGNSTKQRCFVFAGQTYSSFSKCCEVLGISASAVRRIQIKDSVSRKDAMITYVMNHSEKYRELLPNLF